MYGQTQNESRKTVFIMYNKLSTNGTESHIKP